MTTVVPFNDLSRRSPAETAATAAAIKRVLDRGWYLLGPETDAFEAELAQWCGATHAVAVANGTDALELALRAVGCGPGHEVIVAANAGGYGTTACLAVGATPAFADIDPHGLLMDPASAAGLVSERTAAVIVTHLYGAVADVDALRAALPAGLPIVEDAAQAHGARRAGRMVGTLADVATFSFYPTKNLGAVGDAGAVVTNDAGAAAAVRSLRQYGWEKRYVTTQRGGRNSRIDELQAAVLRVALPHLEARNARRLAMHDRYREELGDRLEFPTHRLADTEPVAHLCVARSPRRDALVAALADQGVGASVHYPIADHQQSAIAEVDHRHDDLTETERACAEVLSLPCFPELRDDEIDSVITAVKRST